MRDELNLDDLCGDVMKMNLNDDVDNSLASKNEAGSGVGQKSAFRDCLLSSKFSCWLI